MPPQNPPKDQDTGAGAAAAPARAPAPRTRTAAPEAASPKWVIAQADLYLGGQPGTGSLPQLAHRAGSRLTAESADRNGWAGLVRPAD